MKCLKEKIINLYLELSYARLEWELLKEVDNKIYYANRRINF